MKENKKQGEVRIVNFSSYAKPEIIETPYREYVKYGENNDYYQYLINRYHGSVTNSAIINGMSDMIYGKGLSAYDAAAKPDEYAQMISLFKKKEIKKIIMDFKMLGGAAIQVIYNSAHDAIVEVYHHPVETLRAERANEDGEVDGYYYAKDWTKTYGKGRPERIPAFGTSKEGMEIMFIRNYSPGSFYYTVPEYQSGLPWAEVEEEIASYHINNIKSGFSPTTIINFNNGQASTSEEKRDIENKVYSKFSGTGAKKILLSFNEDSDSETTIQTVQLSEAHNQYQFLSTEAMTKVLMSHRVTSPILFGINTNTGFASNADEIKNASIFMNSTVISPFQETILDHLDDILSFNQIALKLYFIPNQPWNTEDIPTEPKTVE